METPKRKAFCYLRVSGKAQVDGDGFTRQLIAVEKWAAENAVTISRVYREEGETGTVADRPALLEMMEALHENGTRLVVVERLDRLARDLVVQETIIRDLEKNGFALASATEPDLVKNDPSRVLIRQIFGAIAQYDRTMIVVRMRAAKNRMRARGERAEGALPFGEKIGEGETLERMIALRDAGLGYDRIATQLNAEGSKPRRGAKWHGTTVNKILRRVSGAQG